MAEHPILGLSPRRSSTALGIIGVLFSCNKIIPSHKAPEIAAQSKGGEPE